MLNTASATCVIAICWTLVQHSVNQHSVSYLSRCYDADTYIIQESFDSGSEHDSTSFFLLLRAVSVVTTGGVDNLIPATLVKLADTSIPTVEWQLDRHWWHGTAKLFTPRHQRQHLITATPPYHSHAIQHMSMVHLKAWFKLTNINKFTVNHKRVSVWRTSQPAAGVVSAAVNDKYGRVHMHTTLHIHNWYVCLGIHARDMLIIMLLNSYYVVYIMLLCKF